mmetsp:Transcript_139310/g.445428  ORF Transcript_139310/g.445428 Transcript_139310/m.445428 type:complete len:233 (+) Transcript_139310:337-1035(+)
MQLHDTAHTSDTHIDKACRPVELQLTKVEIQSVLPCTSAGIDHLVPPRYHLHRQRHARGAEAVNDGVGVAGLRGAPAMRHPAAGHFQQASTLANTHIELGEVHVARQDDRRRNILPRQQLEKSSSRVREAHPVFPRHLLAGNSAVRQKLQRAHDDVNISRTVFQRILQPLPLILAQEIPVRRAVRIPVIPHVHEDHEHLSAALHAVSKIEELCCVHTSLLPAGTAGGFADEV